ncbi:hypothetical protein Tamer19_74760 [Cupriavidus sp. TA19]|nr:hypothetical protein Tamer19_74760 [Cupriavidus sp. TA19]
MREAMGSPGAGGLSLSFVRSEREVYGAGARVAGRRRAGAAARPLRAGVRGQGGEYLDRIVFDMMCRRAAGTTLAARLPPNAGADRPMAANG